MVSETRTLTFEGMVGAPPAEVYRAFTNDLALRDWLCDAVQVEARAGGRLYLWWNDGYYAAGRFTTLVPAEQVAFSWHGLGEPATTRVQVALMARDAGTYVSVTHAGIGSTAGWSETGTRLGNGWPSHLENLQSVLETGVDLRAARRPTLGLDDAEALTPELAARLGVPANGGMVVRDVVAGMGLEAAGLRKDDVIVTLDGRPVPDWPQLMEALQAHQTGDRVRLAYYRSAELRTAVVELSLPPPQPDPPPTTAALAGVVQAAYAQLREELVACFVGISEEAAAFRPAPGEWCAKELVAHLIACERDLQSWIAAWLLDIDTADNLEGRPNVLPRLAALVSVYSTIPALLEEFQRSSDETVSLLAALPDVFVRRKHLYRRAASAPLGNVEHGHAHVEQIHAVIAAARH